jgi:hypothetical protein
MDGNPSTFFAKPSTDLSNDDSVMISISYGISPILVRHLLPVQCLCQKSVPPQKRNFSNDFKGLQNIFVTQTFGMTVAIYQIKRKGKSDYER